MTDLRDKETRTWKPLTLRIDRAIHADMKILARKDRRSTQNLVNKILSEWVAKKKGGEKDES